MAQGEGSPSSGGGGLGRPKVDVDLDDAEFLRSLKLTWKMVGDVLGVSKSTIFRRMSEEGRVVTTYSSISDDSLDSIVRSVKADHPNDGEVMMAGHLARIGVRVTRARLRASIHRVDPHGVVTRARRVISRRVYSVPHANYAWHIDSHHKLIRWRMVIHGAIDGYSRKILYLKCANNNKASTVVSYFSHAVSVFGLPNRVRSDKGGENVDVWRFMLHYKNMDLSCVITGSSTHNERIERLWSDVFRCVGQMFYTLLHGLEGDGFLNPLNDTDLFCVHLAILPEINRCLNEFVESWNHHCLSSEHNMTPEALFTLGLLQRQCSEPNSVPFSIEGDPSSINLSDYGMNDITVVDIPPTSDSVCPTLHTQLSILQDYCVPSDFGRSLYLEAIQTVGRHIQDGCDDCFV